MFTRALSSLGEKLKWSERPGETLASLAGEYASLWRTLRSLADSAIRTLRQAVPGKLDTDEDISVIATKVNTEMSRLSNYMRQISSETERMESYERRAVACKDWQNGDRVFINKQPFGAQQVFMCISAPGHPRVFLSAAAHQAIEKYGG
jgi:hypothetical protein